MRIAAAADLRFAMPDLEAAFRRREPDVAIETTFGSSGNFYAQLSNDAPFDLFLSADVEYPRRLAEQGQASSETLFQYAVGELVVWVHNDSPLDLDEGPSVAAHESVRKVALANPQHAPYGRAADAALRSLGIYDDVRERLVFADNVAQAAQFVESGAADVGFIAGSLARSGALAGQGKFAVVPADAYPPLVQGGVILKWAVDRDAAAAFRRFLLDDEGRAILTQFGFRLPPGAD